MKYKYKVIFIAGLITAIHMLVMPVKAEDVEKYNYVEASKNSIVEIYTGLSDQEGNFYRIKSTCGCLVSNVDGNTYIISTNHSVQISDDEKETVYKENDLEGNDGSFNTSIYVIVKGDIEEEATIVTKSEVQDFCILSTDNVIQQKEPLKLGKSDDIEIGDKVYTLGFSADSSENKNSQYDKSEVEIHEGSIQDTAAKISEGTYIQHSGVITSGNSGGALLDEKGYMIGLNNSSKTENEIRAFYSLPVETIREVLDNYEIIYESQERTELLIPLMELYEECCRLIEKKGYKNEGQAKLQTVLSETALVLDEQSYNIEKLALAKKNLEEAKDQLKKKMSLTRKIILILAFIILILITWIFYLFLKDRKNGKVTNKKRVDLKNKKTDCNIEDEDDSNNSDNKTIILNEFPLVKLTMIRSGKAKLIDKKEYFIGKKPEQNDWSIPDNKAISRVHAVIRWTPEGFKIYDLKSANGVYVNGVKIEENGRKLYDKDDICIADEHFTFEEIIAW